MEKEICGEQNSSKKILRGRYIFLYICNVLDRSKLSSGKRKEDIYNPFGSPWS